jgi:hypothetical protein
VVFGGLLFGLDLARRGVGFVLDMGALWTFAGAESLPVILDDRALPVGGDLAVTGATGYLPVVIVVVISSSLSPVVVLVSLQVLRDVEAHNAPTSSRHRVGPTRSFLLR